MKISEECFNDIVERVKTNIEETINEVSDKFLKDRDDGAKIETLKAIIRHGETMTPENPQGDPELLKIRQDSICRLKKFRKKCKDYLEKKEKKNDK